MKAWLFGLILQKAAGVIKLNSYYSKGFRDRWKWAEILWLSTQAAFWQIFFLRIGSVFISSFRYLLLNITGATQWKIVKKPQAAIKKILILHHRPKITSIIWWHSMLTDVLIFPHKIHIEHGFSTKIFRKRNTISKDTWLFNSTDWTLQTHFRQQNQAILYKIKFELLCWIKLLHIYIFTQYIYFFFWRLIF